MPKETYVEEFLDSLCEQLGKRVAEDLLDGSSFVDVCRFFLNWLNENSCLTTDHTKKLSEENERLETVIALQKEQLVEYWDKDIKAKKVRGER